MVVCIHEVNVGSDGEFAVRTVYQKMESGCENEQVRSPVAGVDVIGCFKQQVARAQLQLSVSRPA